mmetsp:Transcript_11913/g.30572  ORF Transcript_11913/g.30572 Transcript_11913/m.30572 type:complete len:253 (+) Transcript_11913:173-931(+)
MPSSGETVSLDYMPHAAVDRLLGLLYRALTVLHTSRLSCTSALASVVVAICPPPTSHARVLSFSSSSLRRGSSGARAPSCRAPRLLPRRSRLVRQLRAESGSRIEGRRCSAGSSEVPRPRWTRPVRHPSASSASSTRKEPVRSTDVRHGSCASSERSSAVRSNWWRRTRRDSFGSAASDASAVPGMLTMSSSAPEMSSVVREGKRLPSCDSPSVSRVQAQAERSSAVREALSGANNASPLQVRLSCSASRSS